MNKKVYIISFFLIIVALPITSIFLQDSIDVFNNEEGEVQEFPVFQGTHFTVSNQIGNVVIKQWEEKKLKLFSKYRIREPDESNVL